MLEGKKKSFKISTIFKNLSNKKTLLIEIIELLIPNFWEPPLRTVFENQLVYNLWEPVVWKLAEIFSLKILKPCPVFLKMNVFLKSWDGSFKCHWKVNPVVLNKNWEPAYPSPRSGFADEPHPRLPVQGHILSVGGDVLTSLLKSIFEGR